MPLPSVDAPRVDARLAELFGLVQRTTAERRILECTSRPCARPIDKDAWYPPGCDNIEIKPNKIIEARELCAGCPVMASCLHVGLTTAAGLHGVWAGTTAAERLAMRRGTLPRPMLADTFTPPTELVGEVA